MENSDTTTTPHGRRVTELDDVELDAETDARIMRMTAKADEDL